MVDGVIPHAWTGQAALRTADGVNRADNRLRSFAQPRCEGDAVFCTRCDGAGYVERPSKKFLDPIQKCGRCGCEGLEPEA